MKGSLPPPPSLILSSRGSHCLQSLGIPPDICLYLINVIYAHPLVCAYLYKHSLFVFMKIGSYLRKWFAFLRCPFVFSRLHTQKCVDNSKDIWNKQRDYWMPARKTLFYLEPVLPGYLTWAFELILQLCRIWGMEEHMGTLDYGPANELHQTPYPEQKPVCCGPVVSDGFGHIQGTQSPSKNLYSWPKHVCSSNSPLN